MIDVLPRGSQLIDEHPHRAAVDVLLESTQEEAEPLARDARLHFGAGGDFRAELAHPYELAVGVDRGEDFAARVDGGAIVGRAVAPDGVEVLESEADGIDERMAPGARWIALVLFEFFARGDAGLRVGRLGNVGGRRRELLTEQLLANELATVDGRALGGF